MVDPHVSFSNQNSLDIFPSFNSSYKPNDDQGAFTIDNRDAEEMRKNILTNLMQTKNESKQNNALRGITKTTIANSLALCDICFVSISSETVYNTHIKGKKHQTQLTAMLSKNPEYKAPTFKELCSNQQKSIVINNQIEKSVASSSELTINENNKGSSLMPSKMLNCNICNISCNSQQMFDNHISGKKHRTKLKLANLTGLPPARNVPDNNPSSSNYCDVCSLQLNSEDELTEHLAQTRHQTQVKEEICAKEASDMKINFDDYKISTENTGKDNFNYYCTTCNQSFQNKTQLMDHLKSASHIGLSNQSNNQYLSKKSIRENDQAMQGGTKQGRGKQGGTTQEGITREGTTQEGITREGTTQGGLTREGITHGGAGREGMTHGSAMRGGPTQRDAKRGGAKQRDAKRGGATGRDTTRGGAAQGGATRESTVRGAMRGGTMRGGAMRGSATRGGTMRDGGSIRSRSFSASRGLNKPSTNPRPYPSERSPYNQSFNQQTSNINFGAFDPNNQSTFISNTNLYSRTKRSTQYEENPNEYEGFHSKRSRTHNNEANNSQNFYSTEENYYGLSTPPNYPSNSNQYSSQTTGYNDPSSISEASWQYQTEPHYDQQQYPISQSSYTNPMYYPSNQPPLPDYEPPPPPPSALQNYMPSSSSTAYSQSSAYLGSATNEENPYYYPNSFHA